MLFLFQLTLEKMNKKVYENIRTIREMKDLTRDYVAAELQMSTSGYGKIERGEIDLTLSKLSKICTIFGVSMTDLMYFDISSIFKKDVMEGDATKLSVLNENRFNKERISDLERENFFLKKNNLKP
jgi:transcriptional regulator with XRE-family HTH domain